MAFLKANAKLRKYQITEEQIQAVIEKKASLATK